MILLLFHSKCFKFLRQIKTLKLYFNKITQLQTIIKVL